MATTATTRVKQATAFPPTLVSRVRVGSEAMATWLHDGRSAATPGTTRPC